eukprot:4456415-Lingulodinium_polyedra.AAC.1
MAGLGPERRPGEPPRFPGGGLEGRGPQTGTGGAVEADSPLRLQPPIPQGRAAAAHGVGPRPEGGAE